MQLDVDAMMAALRVLSAIVNQRDPDPAEVEVLRRFAPSRVEVPLDELACDVIQQARNDLGFLETSALERGLSVRAN